MSRPALCDRRVIANRMAPPGRRSPRLWPLALLTAALTAGCVTNGDFGRVRPMFRSDGVHDWMGRDVAAGVGAPISAYPLTDEERTLRDLAFPLIQPPYERQRWESVLAEYGVSRRFRREWWTFDRTAYFRHLTYEPHRSPSSRYAKLNEDIRNDVTRIDPFFAVARTVIDLDRKREQSLGYVSALDPAERANALARIGENTLMVAWVQRALAERAASYRFALERLVIAAPSPMAVEAERSLTLLMSRIGQYRLVAVPGFAGPPLAVSK